MNTWSGKRDSNSRPRPWQGRALPTELFPQKMGRILYQTKTLSIFFLDFNHLDPNPHRFTHLVVAAMLLSDRSTSTIMSAPPHHTATQHPPTRALDAHEMPTVK